MKIKKIEILFAFFSGLLGTISFSPYKIWIFSIFSLFFLILQLKNKSKKESFFIGFLWGLGFFSSGISWLYISLKNFSNLSLYVGSFLILFLISYLSIYPAIFSFLIKYFNVYQERKKIIFLIPTIWSCVEFLREKMFTGFPWMQIGYAHTESPIKNIIPILGIKGANFFVLLVASILFYGTIKKKYLFLAIVVLYFPSIFEFLQKKQNQIKNIQITLVQGNIEQDTKWNKKKIKETLLKYFQKSEMFFGKSEIIIWPESAIADLEENQIEFLKKLDEKLKFFGTNLITGIITQKNKKKNEYYNSIITLGKFKKKYQFPIEQKYKKYNLVLFGEKIPFKKFLKYYFYSGEFSDFHKGEYLQKLIQISKINILPTICYEIIFGERIRKNFSQKVDFILNISNDAWFGSSIGPWQHIQISQIRAIEMGRTIVRCSNSGITAIINPRGKIISILPQFYRGSLTCKVPIIKKKTIYSVFGNIPINIVQFTIFFFSIKIKIRKFQFFFKRLYKK
ncbi:apolipoprotein N-acyltransferase [bacterium endosymbiont of Pedicinus badii]|uniref:apolipoprotein N-acyltransferase n=1 Tax=bacterium endosymbiont of Pedicinus badii TaxID=1719126 RepID=UPI0009BC0AE8|nr:apolipoprotein N-acyltransferase [bacterium endosymbiont of Pedicinus badii]OQM34312.1 hypothetical protein AOQ89_00215 [bacterium endosymbiont of Pedicinus badii]